MASPALQHEPHLGRRQRHRHRHRRRLCQWHHITGNEAQPARQPPLRQQRAAAAPCYIHTPRGGCKSQGCWSLVMLRTSAFLFPGMHTRSLPTLQVCVGRILRDSRPSTARIPGRDEDTRRTTSADPHAARVILGTRQQTPKGAAFPRPRC
ncbi:uncharacterized protein B0I36DRAFT_82697 [Microdochium trichocladiopsis]|uniref:Uncharacterized protein n=1 Tax=Microdochium trichocladiopsis TaxID=1682393 RepID=A0A9P9BSN5_9PEZI|nr:uncharacterized protein B0I36DRAFT_82697 [Microdochium trichocladiopsis]KAH7034637.1 hypothetical protein B0I36DRAFT_82697 [Microdochium trichocladiopsis]